VPVKIRLIQEHDFLALSLESLLKGQENLLLKNLQVKNLHRKRPIFVMENIFSRKYGIQSTNEMALKGPYLYASF